jgi:hypothetical protein
MVFLQGLSVAPELRTIKRSPDRRRLILVYIPLLMSHLFGVYRRRDSEHPDSSISLRVAVPARSTPKLGRRRSKDFRIR